MNLHRVICLTNNTMPSISLRAYLLSQHITLTTVYTWQQLRENVLHRGYDLIWINQQNWYQQELSARIAELRVNNVNEPILLTLDNFQPGEKINLLEAGADDCIQILPDHQELLAYIKLRLTRRPVSIYSCYKLNDIALDPKQMSVTKQGQRLQLRKKEFIILKLLLEEQGRVVSREEIIRRTCTTEKPDIYPATVDVHISRLRKAIENEAIIETVRGLGYRINK